MDLSKYLSPDVLAQHSRIKQQFTSADPFPHVLIEGFFQESFCRELLASFPAFDKKRAINEDGGIGNKSVNELITELREPFPTLHLLVKSPEFLELVSDLTGVPDLKFDPHYFGGGTHENRHGQGLDAHIDFNHHPITDQHRRLNLIVYLNDEWEREWGGLIDLHRDPYLPPQLDDIKSYPPLFNHCVIFETSEHSWHGFTRINQPEDKRHLSRKSLALYYYTDDRPPEQTGPHHSTVYVERHIPPEIKHGVMLTEDQYQLIQGMVSGRDQHLKRLYGYIADLSEQLHQARTHHQKPEVVFEQEAAPEITDELVRHLKTRNFVLNSNLQVLRNSRSWRLTAPLRWLNAHLAGLKATFVNRKFRPCPVSGARGNQLQNLGTVQVTQEGAFSRDEFRLIHCQASDVVYLDPLPTKEDFEVLYAGEQFDSAEYSGEERITRLMEYCSTCIDRHFNLAQFETFHLLEVGAGMAWVSRALKGIDPTASTQAQDISPECVERCDWVDDYFVGSVDAFRKQNQNRYEAISLTHVIEHLPDPVATLKTLAGLLAKKGVILITAPLRPSEWAPEHGLTPWLDYSYLHVPAHLTYFSESAMRDAGQQAGLRLSHWDGNREDGQAFEAVFTLA